MTVHDTTTDTNLISLPFHGDTIVTFEHGGRPYVAMRRIVENMGLNWASQSVKLADQRAKFSCCDIATTGMDGKTYQMLAMPVEKLQLWLVTINPNKIPDGSVRVRVERYQSESAIALHDYWTKGFATRHGDGFSFRQNAGEGARDFQSMLNQVLAGMVDRLVEAKFASSHGSFAPGMSAGEILEMAGFRDRKGLRGLARFVSDKLRLYSARKKVVVTAAKNGISYAYKFDVATARDWLNEGGRKEIEVRIAERRGQGAFKLFQFGTKPPASS